MRKILSGGNLYYTDSHDLLTERPSSRGIEGLNLSNFEQQRTAPEKDTKDYRIFVGTWNVAGKTPCNHLSLEDFLQAEGSSDIYVIGFQEIVPLNAGNVLVIEDNEPAAKWLAIINQALNKPRRSYSKYTTTNCTCYDKSKPSYSKETRFPRSNVSDKHSLKAIKKTLRVDSSLFKICNCPVENSSQVLVRERMSGKFSGPIRKMEEEGLFGDTKNGGVKDVYRLIACKQMVGIFLSIWVRKELVPHVGHLGISSIGRGIMGCLGNKGCIAMSMTLHQTSFCFVCCHLASGDKEGDELRRNADVTEILKSTQFPKLCKNPNTRAPERIMDHERILWLGDLNYRVSLSYEETIILLEDNDWDTLLVKDQLNREKEAGRIFSGFKEGQILFAPTYKYMQNSDSYAGETAKSKKKRRTPSWCDRILWRGNGIKQLSYVRGESRFSDHRPVSSVFSVEVEMRSSSKNSCNKTKNNNNTHTNHRFREGFSSAAPKQAKQQYTDLFPHAHTFRYNVL